MARLNLMSPSKVKGLAKAGTYGDGGGLYLQVRGPEQRSWLFRYKIAGRTRLMGLGAYPEVGLAEAREAAGEARKVLRAGVDPLEQRRKERAEAAAMAGLNTFEEVAGAYIAAHKAGWSNAKHAGQWQTTLATYVYPVIGKLPVATVDTGHIHRILDPIWTTKPETATRVRGRLEAVLDYATAKGWRTGENPARWKGHLAHTLPAREKIARIEHHAALPWAEVGAFMTDLSGQAGQAARALEFVILTATRSGEVLGARWAEISMGDAIWIVPAERMKGKLEHRVPLSDAALDVLREAAKLREGDGSDGLVFPGVPASKPLSDTALFKLLRRMDRADITTHGFRSTFRDWCGETGKASDIAEAALAHKLGNKVQAAYQRGDLLERRRVLMDQWATFCSRPAAAGGQVVQLRTAG
jgi:integrase